MRKKKFRQKKERRGKGCSLCIGVKVIYEPGCIGVKVIYEPGCIGIKVIYEPGCGNL